MPEVEEEPMGLLDGVLDVVSAPIDDGPTANVRLLLTTDSDDDLEPLGRLGTFELDKPDEATMLVLLKVVFAKAVEDEEDVVLLLELVEELNIGKTGAVVVKELTIGAVADTIRDEELHVALSPGDIETPGAELERDAVTVELVIEGVIFVELDEVSVSELIKRFDDIPPEAVVVKLVEDELSDEEGEKEEDVGVGSVLKGEEASPEAVTLDRDSDTEEEPKLLNDGNEIYWRDDEEPPDTGAPGDDVASITVVWPELTLENAVLDALELLPVTSPGSDTVKSSLNDGGGTKPEKIDGS
ncbi:hypothetical protein N0V95_009592 [Ascochyta clinopodiicola]|nr:hypothetical protein N0V95_009592 [Ascochyta clinopodiicola]